MRSLVGALTDAVRGPTIITRPRPPAIVDEAPVPYTTGRQGGMLARALTQPGSPDAQMHAMGSVGTLFQIVHLLSTTTAEVGWHLWRKAESGKDEDRVEVTRHAALDLWTQPNPFMCLAPETRVATTDLRWVPVGSLEVGDSILGFDDDPPAGQRRRWREASVINTGRAMLPCSRVTLADGTSIVASDEHPWLTSRRWNGTYWRKTKHLMSSRPGWDIAPAKVQKFLEPWDTLTTYDAGYLAGMYDGEGHLCLRSNRPGFSLGVTQRDNEAYFEMGSALDRLGFLHKTRVAHRELPHNDMNVIELLGGMPEVLRFLGSVRPKRLLANWETAGADQLGVIQRLANVPVVSVEPLGLREVVTMGTSTGTFVGEGFGQHNTRQEFVEVSQQHLDLTGEAWWVVARGAGKTPLELWPVRPDRMAPVPDPKTYLSGYEYTSPDGQTIPLGLDEVIFLRMPNPADPYRGMGPVQSLLTNLDAVKYTAEWNRNFFANSAEPGGIIQIPEGKRLEDAEFNELRARWQEQHRGVANAHRVAIIEHGTWVDRKYTQRDMQFVELQQVGREIIREAFGMHIQFLGGSDVGHSRAEAEAAEVIFARWKVKPRCGRIKGALNGELLKLYGATGTGLEFDFDSPVPPDQAAENEHLTARANAAKTLVEAGYDRAAVLEVVGLPDMALAAASLTQPAAAPAAAAALLRLPAWRADQPAALPAAARRPWDAGTPPAHLDPAELPDVTPLQDQWEAALAALLAALGPIRDDQKRRLADDVRKLAESGRLSDLTGLTVDTDDAADAIAEAMEDLAAQAAGRVVAEADEQGVTVQPHTPDAADLAEVAAVAAAALGQLLALSAVAAAMRANGPAATAEHVADAVAEALDLLTDAAPADWCGGALTGAQNAARVETLRRAPVGAVYGNERNDRNTCNPCKSVNGKWLGNTDQMDQVLASYPGGAYGGYVGCLGRERCRGTVTGVWR